MNATTRPTNGARKINATVFSTGADSIAVKVPACVIAAPAKPPINVWDDEDGIPNHHVRRFQAIAAINPEKMTGKVIKSVLTVFAMVFATPWSLNIKKAKKLNKAAHNTA